MKRIKDIIIAVLLALLPIILISVTVYLEIYASPKKSVIMYEPRRAFSIPMDTSLYQQWEDNFDTVFTDSWGITTYSHKHHVETR